MIQPITALLHRLIWIPIAINVSAIALALWWLFGPISPGYIPTQIDKHRASADCTRIIVERYFTITRDLTLRIERDLWRENGDGSVTRIEVINSAVDYEAGQHHLIRFLPLPPNLPAGKYQARFTVVYNVNPLREHRVRVPVLEFDHDPIKLGCKQ